MPDGECRRGLTLIEILIAVGLLVAIAAISAPVMVHALDERRFESAGDTLTRTLMLARAHAQASGEPIEIVYAPSGTDRAAAGHLIARRFEIVLRQQQEMGVLDQMALAAGDAIALDGDARLEAVLPDRWAEQRLRRGLSLHDERPEFNDRDATAAVAGQQAGRSAGGGIGGDEVMLRVAVFLPDGSAMLSRTVWLRDDHHRLGRLSINPFTGTPHFERMPNQRDAARRDARWMEDEIDRPEPWEEPMRDEERR